MADERGMIAMRHRGCVRARRHHRGVSMASSSRACAGMPSDAAVCHVAHRGRDDDVNGRFVQETSRPEAMGWNAGRASARATPSIHPMLMMSTPTRMRSTRQLITALVETVEGIIPHAREGWTTALPHLQGRPTSGREVDNRGTLHHRLSR